jgi:hypothetical protein
MTTIRRLSDSDVRAIFEAVHTNHQPPPHLHFQIVPIGPDGLKLSPPSHEFPGSSKRWSVKNVWKKEYTISQTATDLFLPFHTKQMVFTSFSSRKRRGNLDIRWSSHRLFLQHFCTWSWTTSFLRLVLGLSVDRSSHILLPFSSVIAIPRETQTIAAKRVALFGPWWERFLASHFSTAQT